MAGKRKRRRGKGKAFSTNPAAPVRHVGESPIQFQKRRGLLNVWELTAADEIAAAYQMSIGAPVARDPDLGLPPASPRPDAADDQAARRTDLLRVYQVWRRTLCDSLALRVTTAVVVREQRLRAFESEVGMRHGTARVEMLRGLRAFAALRGNTPRWGRDWKWSASSQQS